jgi:oligopeptidase B
MKNMPSSAPVAPRKPVKLEKHGDVRIDPYYWLNQKEDPAVMDYLKAENIFTEEVLSDQKHFRESLFAELKGRIKQKDDSAPYRNNGYYYQARYDEGKEYPAYFRKADKPGEYYQSLLDINELAEDHAYYDDSGLIVSPDNRLLAFGEDTISRRIYTLRFKNLETEDFLEDTIPGTSGAYAWSADSRYIFYTLRNPETLRAYQVKRHEMGTSPDTDEVVFEETDETFSCFVYKTNSKKYLVIGSYQTVSQEYRILDASDPLGQFQVFQPRERNLEYSIDHAGNQFYILTNLQAKNFRVMTCPVDNTEKNNWQELIPHREEVLVEDIDAFVNHLVVTERYRGIVRIQVRPRSGKAYYLPFEEEAYLAYTSEQQEFNTATLRLGYQSMTTPPSVYNFDLENNQFELLKQQEVLGGFNRENYRTERLFAPVRDGQKVPISLVYHRDTPRNGTAPLLLYGYGSYGATMAPYFSTARRSLLNRGVSFAIAHVRGGEELGRHSDESGKLLQKKNTFYDFIDCGKYLIQEKYAAPNGLYAMGGSAGGLLIGAVMNMAPELWSGLIAAVPFVDVVTTMLDDSIPLTTFEYDEWGNPNEKPFYDYMKSYSPYDNVEKKAYPPLMVTTGLHDSQVQYWEPAKWVARLREYKTDDNPLLLHTNLDAGHGGASGRFQRLKEVALEYTFLLDLAGKVE